MSLIPMPVYLHGPEFVSCELCLDFMLFLNNLRLPKAWRETFHASLFNLPGQNASALHCHDDQTVQTEENIVLIQTNGKDSE